MPRQRNSNINRFWQTVYDSAYDALAREDHDEACRIFRYLLDQPRLPLLFRIQCSSQLAMLDPILQGAEASLRDAANALATYRENTMDDPDPETLAFVESQLAEAVEHVDQARREGLEALSDRFMREWTTQHPNLPVPFMRSVPQDREDDEVRGEQNDGESNSPDAEEEDVLDGGVSLPPDIVALEASDGQEEGETEDTVPDHDDDPMDTV